MRLALTSVVVFLAAGYVAGTQAVELVRELVSTFPIGG